MNKRAKLIMETLNSYRKNPFNEIFDSSLIEEKINNFIKQKSPIIMVVPGFHGKINNPDFVFGNSIDMGDYIGIQNWIGLVQTINNIYEYGCHLYIVHEYHFYIGRSYLVDNEDAITQYLSDFRELIADYKNIHSITIFDMLSKHKSLADNLITFNNEYMPTREAVDELLTTDIYLNLYKAYKKVNRVNLEKQTDYVLLSKQKKHLTVKEFAFTQLQIYCGFSILINQYFKNIDYIRLSTLYKSPEFKNCIAINYLPHVNHMSTPTFNCVVKHKNGLYNFIKRKDAIKNNFIETTHLGLKYFLEC